jgi:capsular polysaccharide biosynthesis protein
LLYPNANIHHSKTCPENCVSLCQDGSIPTSRESGVDPNAYIYLRTVLLPHVERDIPINQYSEYIYISRKDTNKRRIMNEHQLVKNHTFSSMFQIVVLSTLPIIEQLYIFYKAKVIVSIHGAALTHILCCNQNAKIIEISSNKIANLLHFEHIANTLQLNYERYLDVLECIPKNDYNSDLIIPNVPLFLDKIDSTKSNILSTT